MIKSGSVWAGTFVTLDATGALAAGTPSGTLYVDGVANGASVTITGSNPYKFSVTLPTLTAGQRVDMYITATISGIATAAIVASEQADTALVSDVNTAVANVPTVAEFEARTLVAADYFDPATDAVATVTNVSNAVKISTGTGTGQLDITGGVVKANLAQILGTALTETTGQIAAAFQKFFDKASPTGTINSLPDAVPGTNGGLPTTNGSKVNQTVDLTAGHGLALDATVAKDATVSKPGTPQTISSNADITAIKAKTDQLAFTVANQVDANALTGSATAEDVRIEMDLNSTKLADILADTGTDGVVLKAAGLSADAVVEIQSGLATTQHVQEVEDKVDTIDGIVDAVKAKTDLITTGTAITIVSPVSGSTITAIRGDTLSAALENIGALTNYSKLWFTVKRDYDDADTAAVIQIEKTGGLLYLNGAVGTAGNGSLTINDEATGDVTIVLNASETAKLSPGNYQYDIQILRSAGTPVSTLTYGEFVVPADVTRATS